VEVQKTRISVGLAPHLKSGSQSICCRLPQWTEAAGKCCMLNM